MVICALSFVTQAPAGTIRGRVQDTSGKPLKDAVVFIESGFGSRKFPAPTRKAKMDTADYVFQPHVLAIQAGATVEFTNGDWELHNFYSTSPGEPFDLDTIARHQVVPKKFTRPGVIHVQCHRHEEMSAYIVVCPTPYFAVTNAKGQYAIPNVPPGRYKLKAWHETAHETAREVSAGSGPATLDFQLTLKPPTLIENPAFKPLY